MIHHSKLPSPAVNHLVLEERVNNVLRFYQEYLERDKNNGGEYVRRSHNMYSSLPEVMNILSTSISLNKDLVQGFKKIKRFETIPTEDCTAITGDGRDVHCSVLVAEEMLTKAQIWGVQ